MNDQKGKTIKGLYFNGSVLEPQNISGASVAISSTGKLVLSLFDELPKTPDNFEIQLDSNGQVVKQSFGFDDDYELIRFNKCIAVMDLEVAQSISKLIIDNINAFMSMGVEDDTTNELN